MKGKYSLLVLLFAAVGLVSCATSKTAVEKQTAPATAGRTAPSALTGVVSTRLQAAVDILHQLDATQEALAATALDSSTSVPATPEPVSAPTATPAPTAALIQHQVQPGDTLLGLATRYDISMAAIQLANGMGNSINLIAGDTLVIPTSQQWDGESFFWSVHVVQSGDTLVGLAQVFGLTVDDILRVNAVADPALIRVDQQLVMPLTQLVTLKKPAPTPEAIASASQETNRQMSAGLEVSDSVSSTVAAGTTPSEPAPTSPPPPGMPAGPGDWPAYILTRINQARAENGLQPLSMAPELSYAAQAHAEDCARRGWGSHVGSDGAVLKTRLERAGYPGTAWGENWVQALNAERGFDWWYGEIPPNDAHRRNILSPRYTEIGIGIAQSGWGYVFVTDFGQR
jgi:uncharacterized protein YkwD